MTTAFPGADYNYTMIPGFPEKVQLAFAITKEIADRENWPKRKRKIYDWIFTLKLTLPTLSINSL